MKMRMAGVWVLVLAMLPVAAWSGALPDTNPERVGLSSDRLDRISHLMEGHVGNGDIVGAVGMVARKGKLVWSDTWGLADREQGTPMELDTIFRIYSMSKPIVSVGLMTLYEEGKFGLEDPVAWYLPELADMQVVVEDEASKSQPAYNIPTEEGAEVEKVELEYETEPAARPITIQDLLRHTSGMTYGFFGNSIADQLYMQEGLLVEDRDIAETVRKLGELPLKHQPGTRWEYSVSVDVQGRLIEVLSGQPLDVFLEERIFGPLGMKDTAFTVPEEKLDRFAQLYSPAEEGQGLIIGNSDLNRNYVEGSTYFSGGGGLVSTAGDYLRFAQMLLNGGELDGTRILGRKTVELMTVDHLNDLPNPLYANGYGFGLGFAVAQDLGRMAEPGSPGEFNWGGAAGTRFWVDPEEELIGVYMVQILPHSGLTYGVQFRRLVYSAIVD